MQWLLSYFVGGRESSPSTTSPSTPRQRTEVGIEKNSREINSFLQILFFIQDVRTKILTQDCPSDTLALAIQDVLFALLHCRDTVNASEVFLQLQEKLESLPPDKLVETFLTRFAQLEQFFTAVICEAQTEKPKLVYGISLSCSSNSEARSPLLVGLQNFCKINQVSTLPSILILHLERFKTKGYSHKSFIEFPATLQSRKLSFFRTF